MWISCLPACFSHLLQAELSVRHCAVGVTSHLSILGAFLLALRKNTGQFYFSPQLFSLASCVTGSQSLNLSEFQFP